MILTENAIDGLIKALSHPLRHKLLKYAALNHPENITIELVSTLYNVRQSIASKHLTLLVEAGFLKKRRVGKYVTYALDTKTLDKFIEYFDHIVPEGE